MRILIVHNFYHESGGEDEVFQQECSLLANARHDIRTYCRSNAEIATYTAWQRVGLAKRVIWASDTHEDFATLLQRERPEIIHVHNTFALISPAIYSACSEAHIPVVQTLHNYRLSCPAATFFRNGGICEECTEHGFWRGIRHGCYRGSRTATANIALMLSLHRKLGTWREQVDCYVALTEFARRKFIAGGLPPEKIVVKPNCLYADPGEGNCTREYALFVGRLDPVKGVATLLTAWARLPYRIPLHVVGDGPLRTKLEAQASQLGLANVRIHGQLSRGQVVEFMKSARFLIFPSEWYEGFPMTIAEAFACGTPVICSRLGAMEEIVADGRTGLHFSAGNAEEIAQKTEWAWAHPSRMAEMGRAARAEYETKYTAQRNYRLLMDIYERAIQIRKAA